MLLTEDSLGAVGYEGVFYLLASLDSPATHGFFNQGERT